jgi:CDP-paratose 2-epimerase
MDDHILIVGGAGFVGSSLALFLKNDYPRAKIVSLDNLRRPGSELNIQRLKSTGIEFIHGDIRSPNDLDSIGRADILIDCAAEPSVLAGYTKSPEYIINTNLNGTINCLELARRRKADVIFLSTSRVYPIEPLRSLELAETNTRFQLKHGQNLPGVTAEGISEQFTLSGFRSLYGASKLASELILTEYIDLYDIKGVVNRCGVLTGPWQMGKIEQGFFALWVAQHIYGGHLSYIGFGGSGKQVRDVLHIRDLYELLDFQINNLTRLSGQIFNVGGGKDMSTSLHELTDLCRNITGNQIPIHCEHENRPGDIAWYISACNKVKAATGWQPRIQLNEIVKDISAWINEHFDMLRPILT